MDFKRQSENEKKSNKRSFLEKQCESDLALITKELEGVRTHNAVRSKSIGFLKPFIVEKRKFLKKVQVVKNVRKAKTKNRTKDVKMSISKDQSIGSIQKQIANKRASELANRHDSGASLSELGDNSLFKLLNQEGPYYSLRSPDNIKERMAMLRKTLEDPLINSDQRFKAMEELVFHSETLRRINDIQRKLHEEEKLLKEKKTEEVLKKHLRKENARPTDFLAGEPIWKVAEDDWYFNETCIATSSVRPKLNQLNHEFKRFYLDYWTTDEKMPNLERLWACKILNSSRARVKKEYLPQVTGADTDRVTLDQLPLKKIPPTESDLELYRCEGPPPFCTTPQQQDDVFKNVITLKETKTLNIFSCPTKYIYRESSEHEQEGFYKEKLLQNVSKIDNFTQVKEIINNEQESVTDEIITYDQGTFVTEFDFVAFTSLESKTVGANDFFFKGYDSPISDGDEEEVDYLKIVSSKKFRETVNFVERILSTNWLVNNFLTYRTKEVSSEINYKVVNLFSFKHPVQFRGQTFRIQKITDIAWSETLDEIIAVGYGAETNANHYGLVCVWNLKNVNHPEKLISYKKGVAHVEFSKTHPYVLAVSYLNGFIGIYNIYPDEPQLIYTNGDAFIHCQSPVWDMLWVNNIMQEEILLVCDDNGAIVSYPKNNFLAYYIMTVSPEEDTVEGYEGPKKHPHYLLPDPPGITTMVQVPNEKDYFLLGMNEGSIRLVSVLTAHEERSIFDAHSGRVNRCEFNPFCPKVFLTAGGDFSARIWALGVLEPLFSLNPRNEHVIDAAWSPTNSTILVTVGMTYIDVWDLWKHWKGHPMASYRNPNSSLNTRIRFSFTGPNFAVGDENGDLHMYHLKEMPMDPFLQQEALVGAIERNISQNPKLVKKLKKTGYPFQNLKVLKMSDIFVEFEQLELDNERSEDDSKQRIALLKDGSDKSRTIEKEKYKAELISILLKEELNSMDNMTKSINQNKTF